MSWDNKQPMNGVLRFILLVHFAVGGLLFAQQPYRITYLPSNRAEAAAASLSPATNSGSEIAEISRQGQESSACNSKFEERQSLGNARAESRQENSTESSITFSLQATAAANGGHFVRYATCIGNLGIGPSGEDTSASSRAVSQADVEIAFLTNAFPERYLLDVNVGTTEQGTRVSISDSTGAVLFQSERGGTSLAIQSGPGVRYRISVVTEVTAGHSGGTGRAERSARVLATVNIRPTALITNAQAVSPRIVGGLPTTGYPAVGAILFRGQMHCTGTIVAPRTVLTAAHCLFGRDAKEMTFLQGSDVAASSNKVFPVSGSDYPKGENGFKYVNAYPYPDDVGVIYLDSTVAPAATLHKGKPPLTVTSSQQLDFVGFGYALTNGSLNGLGVKREVRMPLSQLTEKTYQYSVLGANTCNGDSGGPAFIGTQAMPILTGVTSYGDAACSSFGVNTRIEAYMDWLEPRLK